MLLLRSEARKVASSAHTEDRRPRNANAVVENFMIVVGLTSGWRVEWKQRTP